MSRIELATTLVALVAFGWANGLFAGAPPARSAMRTTLVGGIAAGAAFAIARALG